jgi:hypothetical protein
MEIFKSIYDLAAVELRSRGITTISQPIVNGLGCLQRFRRTGPSKSGAGPSRVRKPHSTPGLNLCPSQCPTKSAAMLNYRS